MLMLHAVQCSAALTLPLFQCMQQYITFEVMEGAYDISCPDPECSSQVWCYICDLYLFVFFL
jgi:hypothetical protein